MADAQVSVMTAMTSGTTAGGGETDLDLANLSRLTSGHPLQHLQQTGWRAESDPGLDP